MLEAPLTKIGIFDSGVGGLSVWKAIREALPQHPTHYLADQAFCPYGNLPASLIRIRSALLTKQLMAQGCGLIVLACNTATAAAIGTLRERFSIPFVGMEPAIKPAARLTQTGHVGVLATEGTLKGALYQQTKERHAYQVTVHTQIGHGLVELVEDGLANSAEAEKLLLQYLQPMVAAGVDHLVLGCTHYPFLSNTIHRLFGDALALLDPAPAIAERVAALLPPTEGPAASSEHVFESTAHPISLKNFLETTGLGSWEVGQISL